MLSASFRTPLSSHILSPSRSTFPLSPQARHAAAALRALLAGTAARCKICLGVDQDGKAHDIPEPMLKLIVLHKDVLDEAGLPGAAEAARRMLLSDAERKELSDALKKTNPKAKLVYSHCHKADADHPNHTILTAAAYHLARHQLDAEALVETDAMMDKRDPPTRVDRIYPTSGDKWTGRLVWKPTDSQLEAEAKAAAEAAELAAAQATAGPKYEKGIRAKQLERAANVMAGSTKAILETAGPNARVPKAPYEAVGALREAGVVAEPKRVLQANRRAAAEAKLAEQQEANKKQKSCAPTTSLHHSHLLRSLPRSDLTSCLRRAARADTISHPRPTG